MAPSCYIPPANGYCQNTPAITCTTGAPNNGKECPIVGHCAGNQSVTCRHDADCAGAAANCASSTNCTPVGFCKHNPKQSCTADSNCTMQAVCGKYATCGNGPEPDAWVACGFDEQCKNWYMSGTGSDAYPV